MIRCLKRTLVIGQLLGFSFAFGQQKPVYFDDYRALADSLSLVYQIPSCVMLAVAYHESGGGVSVVAKKLNNHFGIVGDCRYDITKHKSKYRYYPNIVDSYIGFCNLVASKKFYESMKGNTDEKLWLKKLGATGYASDPNWPTTVYKVVLNKCH